MNRRYLSLGIALALSGCGDRSATTPAAQATASAEPSEVAIAEASAAASVNAPEGFGQCKVCHSAERGNNGIGPSLAGVYGTRAGQAKGFAFSTAMTGSGLTWDDATLDRFIEAPMKVVPGTRMTFPGIKDPAKRKDVVAYLKTI
jgi:cytochrome c